MSNFVDEQGMYHIDLGTEGYRAYVRCDPRKITFTWDAVTHEFVIEDKPFDFVLKAFKMNKERRDEE